MKSLEAIEQCNVIKYCEYKRIPVFHIPNGGSRNAVEAANLKLQGVKPGVPDLFFPAARNDCHGLFIEMKAGKNKTTSAQKEWLKLLSDNGYMTAVCYGFDEAKAVIDTYFNERSKSNG